MKQPLLTVLYASLLGLSLMATPVLAQSRNDQGEARREMQAGNVLSLREIEQIVLPTMNGAKYLGPSYDSTAMAYRLKFIRDGRVMFVDVDARSGRILRRTR